MFDKISKRNSDFRWLTTELVNKVVSKCNPEAIPLSTITWSWRLIVKLSFEIVLKEKSTKERKKLNLTEESLRADICRPGVWRNDPWLEISLFILFLYFSSFLLLLNFTAVWLLIPHRLYYLGNPTALVSRAQGPSWAHLTNSDLVHVCESHTHIIRGSITSWHVYWISYNKVCLWASHTYYKRL